MIGLSNNYGLGAVTSFPNIEKPNYMHGIQTLIRTEIEKVTSDEFTINVQNKTKKEEDNLKITFDIDFQVDVNSKESLESMLELHESIYETLNSYMFRKNRNIKYYTYFPDVFNKPRSDTSGKSQVILVIGYYSRLIANNGVTREQYLDVSSRLNQFLNGISSSSRLLKTPAVYKTNPDTDKQEILTSPTYYKISNIKLSDSSEIEAPDIVDDAASVNTDFTTWGIYIGLAVLIILVAIVVGLVSKRFFNRKSGYNHPSLYNRDASTLAGNVMSHLRMEDNDQAAIIENDELNMENDFTNNTNVVS